MFSVIVIWMYLTSVLNGLTTVQCLTCKEVLEMPTHKNLTFMELTSMPAKDINDCLQHIASEPLRITDARFIWRKVTELYGDVSKIPQTVLAKLQWVTVAIAPQDYAKMNIDTIDTVKNFGFSYNLHYTQLKAIADRVRQNFSGKSPEDYTCYDLMALNQILCAFNTSEIERIHPVAYKESAPSIGKLKNCSSDVMTAFAHLALHKDAFGPLEKWTGSSLEAVGNVVNYLPGGISKKIRDKLEADYD